MNFIDLVRTANHNLLRNKTRTFLTILAIFIGSFTIILNTAINAGVNDFIDRQVESIGGDGYIEISPKALYDQMFSMASGEIQEYAENAKSIETSYLDDETLEKLESVDGVESLNAYQNLSIDYITSDYTNKKYKITLNLLPDDTIHVDMVSGRQVEANSDNYEIMLTEDYTKKLGFENNDAAINKKVQLIVPVTLDCMTTEKRKDCQKTVTATVTGVAADGVMSMGAGVRVNLALYNHLVDLQYNGLPASQKVAYMATGHIDPTKLDSIREAFEKEGFTVITIDDEVGMIRTFFDAILIVFNIFGVIALLAAAIGIVNTLFMSVQERTREIGLMKAMGMSSGKIFASFSLEAILLGFWGSIFGIAVSVLIGSVANHIASETFLASFPTFSLTKFEPATMISITLIIMFIAFIAGTLPARRASKKDPIDALRYE